MTTEAIGTGNSMALHLDDVLLRESAQTSVADDSFKAIDQRINSRIAEGLKKGTKLVFHKLNTMI